MLITFAIFMGIGWLIMMIGGILLLVAAFRESIPWGLAVLFLPFAAFVFLFMHWPEAKRPFLYQVCGLVIMMGGMGAAMMQGFSLAKNDLPAMVEDSLGEEQMARLAEAFENIQPEAGEAGDAPPAEALGKDDPRHLIGKSLEEARRKHGRPKGEMVSGSQICYLYPGFSVFSKDGETVSHVEVDGEDETVPGKKKAKRGSQTASEPPVRVVSEGGKRIDLASVLVPGKVTMVDFYADWCGPCRMLSPRLEQLAIGDPKVVLCKIDIVNWGTDIAKQFNIRSIPNVRVYDAKGRMIGQPSSQLAEIRQNLEQAK